MRPATPLICAFIDEHKNAYGVVPICRALAVRGMQIAPRTYWAHRSAAPSKRALWDTTITEILAGYYEPDADGKRPPESLYGSLKMWAHLQRQGIPVARRTVERIMRRNGWQGVTSTRRARAPPNRTRPRPGPRIWSTASSPHRHRTSCGSPTSNADVGITGPMPTFGICRRSWDGVLLCGFRGWEVGIVTGM